jgi:hypothetical protein
MKYLSKTTIAFWNNREVTEYYSIIDEVKQKLNPKLHDYIPEFCSI